MYITNEKYNILFNEVNNNHYLCIRIHEYKKKKKII